MDTNNFHVHDFHVHDFHVHDFHVHTFPDKIATGALSKLAQIANTIPVTNGTVSNTLEFMEKCNVDSCSLMNIATSPKQQKAVNDGAYDIMKQYEGKLFPYGSVHFQADDAPAELERIKKMGLYGVKLHPDYQGFMVDDKCLFDIYDTCQSLSLPILFHAGYDPYSKELVHCSPQQSAKILKQFPKLTVILAHFGGLKMWDEVETELIGKNVWFDTAMCASFADNEQIKRMILKHDSNKILFGSDCPWENPAQSYYFLERMNLPIDIFEKIVSSNAKIIISKNNL